MVHNNCRSSCKKRPSCSKVVLATACYDLSPCPKMRVLETSFITCQSGKVEPGGRCGGLMTFFGNSSLVSFRHIQLTFHVLLGVEKTQESSRAIVMLVVTPVIRTTDKNKPLLIIQSIQSQELCYREQTGIIFLKNQEAIRLHLA